MDSTLASLSYRLVLSLIVCANIVTLWQVDRHQNTMFGPDISRPVTFECHTALGGTKQFTQSPMTDLVSRQGCFLSSRLNQWENCVLKGVFVNRSLVLQRFTPTSTLEEISETRTKLRKQLQSVSKRVSELILGNHQAYAAELERVMELQDSLQTALIICSASRRWHMVSYQWSPFI